MPPSPDNPRPDNPPPNPVPVIDDDLTGLRLLPSWRGVYVFVLASFVLWIVLLVALTRMYS